MGASNAFGGPRPKSQVESDDREMSGVHVILSGQAPVQERLGVGGLMRGR